VCPTVLFYSPIPDVQRRIQVSVLFKVTALTSKYAVTQTEIYVLPAALMATLTARSKTVNLYEYLAAPASLVFKLPFILVPTTVGYRLRKMMITHHALNIEIFQNYTVALGYRTTGTLVLKISPYIAYLAMYPTYSYSLLPSVATALRPLAQTSLSLTKFFLISLCDLLVLDYFAIAVHGKSLQPNVNADDIVILDFWLTHFDFNIDRTIPLVAVLLDHQMPHLAFNGSMLDPRYLTNLRDEYETFAYTELVRYGQLPTTLKGRGLSFQVSCWIKPCPA